MATARGPRQIRPTDVRKASRQAVAFLARADVLKAIDEATADPYQLKRLLSNPISYFKHANVPIPRGALITTSTRAIHGSVTICVQVCFVVRGFTICVQICGTIVFGREQ